MEWARIAENWERMRVLARERWPRLSDKDLDLVEGDRTELIALLETRYGWDTERATHEVGTWQESDTHPPSFNRPESLRDALRKAS